MEPPWRAGLTQTKAQSLLRHMQHIIETKPKGDAYFAASGNRTRLSRVTGGDTDRYTNATLCERGVRRSEAMRLAVTGCRRVCFSSVHDRVIGLSSCS